MMREVESDPGDGLHERPLPRSDLKAHCGGRRWIRVGGRPEVAEKGRRSRCKRAFEKGSTLEPTRCHDSPLACDCKVHRAGGLLTSIQMTRDVAAVLRRQQRRGHCPADVHHEWAA